MPDFARELRITIVNGTFKERCHFQKLDALKLTLTKTLSSTPEALFISTPVH